MLEGWGFYFVVAPSLGGLAEFVFYVSAFAGIFGKEVPGTSGFVDLHVWVSVVWGVIRMLCEIGFVMRGGIFCIVHIREYMFGYNFSGVYQ